ncbi:MAG TPA: adenosine deaminase, partial [Caulobacteraceae bacterium]|nr:adenosine deaminase [Caulobacteraceae bacterium]
RVVDEGMTLTVCPLSNLKLCVVDDLKDHPIPRMLDLGIRATINSDDPAYFGGYVGANYVELARATGLGREALVTLARNSFEGAFLGEAEKARHLAEIERYAVSAA